MDCLAGKADAAVVIAAAAEILDAGGVDLLVSNQGDEAWGRACQANGF